ncbi:hypothetical protein HPB49_002641 [Dermacentor silvarum]|uniref:Uncharacterized protein n=1 Tax=Dermacentor silvarum TaxID=543639 RepID=A0ACB8CUL7_DERSI|nr:uncharacterized protein LOC119448796 [Dermacentor silvarum]KAH7952928.1 hypothetical protein HPB49_002641 [Dermacentor silvarum]
MTWGARSLVCNATAVLLLDLALISAKTSLVIAGSPKSTAAVDRLRRDDDQRSEVFIEHVKGVDDTQAALSLFIGFLILGGVILVVLFFLGCLLLLRLSESSRPAKYHRLLSSQETCSHRHHSHSVTGQERSQVFTYVDLTTADGSCQDHRQLAPRFLAKFQTATKVDVSDSESRLEQQRGEELSAEARSQLAKTSLPFSAGTAGVPPVRRARSEEVGGSHTFAGKEAAGAADRASQPPPKRICVQRITGAPKYHSGSLHDERGSDNYGERSAKVTSDEPPMEISVRDRIVQVRPHGDSSGNESPIRSGAAHTVHQAAPGNMNRSSSAQYREQYDWNRNHSNLPLDQTTGISSIGPFSPWLPSPNGSGTSPPLFPNDFHAFTASDHSSEDTLRSHQVSKTLSGHGRSYEQHVPDGRRHATAAACSTSPLGSGVDSGLVKHDPSSEMTQPFQVPNNGSGAGFVALNADSVSARTSETVRKQFGHEAAEVKQTVTSTGKPTEGTTLPLTIKTSVTLQGIPSRLASETGSPQSSEPRELTVRVPEMITYLEHPGTPTTFKANFNGTAVNDQTNLLVSSGTQSRTSPKGGSSPVSPMIGSKPSRQLRLPQPPRERHDKEVQANLRVAKSASKHRSSTSARRHRRGGHSSGELVTMREPSVEQVSATHPLPEHDVSSSHLDTAKMIYTTTVPAPRPETSLVPCDSPPSKESSSLEIGQDGRMLTRTEEGSTMQHEPNGDTGHVDETTRPADSVNVKAEVSVTSPWPVVVAEDKPVQPSERNIAVMKDSPPGEVAKHGENSEAGHVESALESSARDNHIAGKEREMAVDSKSDKDEERLATAESHKADVHKEHRERREPETRLEDETTIESRVQPKWLLVERTSQELASSDQSNQQLTTLSDRALAPPVSQHPIEIGADAHLVTSPAHQTTLASSSPISSRSGVSVDVIDQSKPLAIKAAEHATDDTRSLATAARRDLDVTPSTDITKHERATELVESSERKTSVTTPEGHQKALQADSSSASEVRERTESTDVFFTPTSPVAAQGSKDLISFNSEPSASTPAERTEEKRIDTEAPKMNASSAKDDVPKPES